MAFKSLFIALLVSLTSQVYAGDPLVDKSKAGSDGPHVFYRGKNIVVKTVEQVDTGLVVRVKYYSKPQEVKLKCVVPETGDAFSFTLKDKLKVDKDRFALPDRMLVVSDIEGNFEAFKRILQGARVIDDKFNWIYGNGHLVLVGDFFDRGLNVTECLWLIYKLESEAEKAGGNIHFIIGNHEAMNLCGEYGYVRNKYMENAQLIGEEYGLWYDDHSELGRWLRTKNAIVKIGDFAFCHGGISPYVANSTLRISDLNYIVRRYLGVNYGEIVDSLAQYVFHPEVGVLWFRGASKNKISREEMDAALAFAGVKRIVVGHTLVPDVMALYDGSLVCVDLFHDENLRADELRTLYVEKGNLYSLDVKGVKSSVFTLAYKSKE